MIVLPLILAVAAASTTGTPQIIERRAETGSRVVTDNPMPSVVVDAQRAASMRRLTAQCIVERQPGVARRVVAASNESGIDYARLGIPPARFNAALSIETCMERTMNAGDGLIQWDVNNGTMRGLIVDALYRTTFKTLPNVAWQTVKPLPVAELTIAGKPTGPSAATAFGECIVRTDPADADRFIRTEPGSAAESVAVAAVMPAIQPCLQAGSTLSLRKAALRVILADALWRLANGTPETAASKAPGAN